MQKYLVAIGLLITLAPAVANATWDYVPPSKKAEPLQLAPTPMEPYQESGSPIIIKEIPYRSDFTRICATSVRYASDQGVAKTQMMLAIAGFDPGSFDGIMGPKTANAVRKYQATMNIPVDGCISAELFEHIWRSSLHIRGPLLQGKAAVFETQVLLTRLGYYLGDVDGILGNQTRDAIKEFQRANKQKVNGKVDNKLMKKLREVHAKRSDDPYEK